MLYIMLYILPNMYVGPTFGSIVLCINFGVPTEAMIP